MNKSTCLFIIVFFALVSHAYADFSKENQFILEKYGYRNYYNPTNAKNTSVNNNTSSNYDVIVYGSPIGGKYSNLTHKFEPRFLGESNIGELLPNYNYSYDSKSNIFFDDMYWLKDPSTNPIIVRDKRYSWVVSNPFVEYVNDSQIKKSFLSGMHLQHGNPDRPAGDWFRGDAVNKRGEPVVWEDYIHIIDPPTEWTHGSAMLWHVSELDGKLYYIDVRLTRFMDLAGRLQVRHRAVNGQRLSSFDYGRSLPDGAEVAVDRTVVDGYEYVGFGISASDGTAPLQSSGSQFRMRYEYAHDRQLYTLTFYYRPNSVTIPPGFSGAITISHPIYDVTRGIPTGERANIEARVDRPFLMDYRWRQVVGSGSVQVLVRQPYTVERLGRVVRDVAEASFSVSRSYSYYEVTQLYAYGLRHVNVMNPKLALSGSVTLSGAQSAGSGAWLVPKVTFTRPSDHVGDIGVSGASYDGSLGAYVLTLPVVDLGAAGGSGAGSGTGSGAGPSFDLAGAAEAAVGDFQVRSDAVAVNGEVLMDGGWWAGSTPVPMGASSSREIAAAGRPVVLKRPEHLIVHGIVNGLGETDGAAYFDALARYNVADTLQVAELEGNSVRVHTPVVATARFIADARLDQRPEANSGAAGTLVPALPLDTLMRVDLGTQGAHLALPGYGVRDYGRFVKVRRLYLPFDAFCFWDAAGTDGGFVPAGSWTTVPAGVQAAFLRAPAWVTPQDYDLLYQVVALNHRNPASHQLAANLDLAKDIAGAVVPVRITGKLYGFQVTDFTDARWASLFMDRSLAARDLPMARGSHSDRTHKDLAPKPGYVLRFKINSTGPYFDAEDLIYLKPSFAHIDSRSGARQAVDLYYKNGGRWVALGSDRDTFEWHTPLQNGRRDLNIKALAQTGKLLNALGLSASQPSWIAESLVPKYVAKVRSIALGYYRRLLGPEAALGGSGGSGNSGGSGGLPSSIPGAATYAPSEAVYAASYQTWYGEYLLPNQLLVVPRGSLAPGASLDAYGLQGGPGLRDGYLAVSFEIALARGNQLAAKELVYGHQWLNEGYGGRAQVGDVIYYDLAALASHDWQ